MPSDWKKTKQIAGFLSPPNVQSSVHVEYKARPYLGGNISDFSPSGQYPKVFVRWRDRSREPHSVTLTDPKANLDGIPARARPLVREAWGLLEDCPRFTL